MESHEEIFLGPCESNLRTKNMAQHPLIWSSHPHLFSSLFYHNFHHCFIMETVISIIKVKEHPILFKMNNLWLHMINVKTIQSYPKWTIYDISLLVVIPPSEPNDHQGSFFFFFFLNYQLGLKFKSISEN